MVNITLILLMKKFILFLGILINVPNSYVYADVGWFVGGQQSMLQLNTPSVKEDFNEYVQSPRMYGRNKFIGYRWRNWAVRLGTDGVKSKGNYPIIRLIENEYGEVNHHYAGSVSTHIEYGQSVINIGDILAKYPYLFDGRTIDTDPIILTYSWDEDITLTKKEIKVDALINLYYLDFIHYWRYAWNIDYYAGFGLAEAYGLVSVKINMSDRTSYNDSREYKSLLPRFIAGASYFINRSWKLSGEIIYVTDKDYIAAVGINYFFPN